jgi:hypothetical protein
MARDTPNDDDRQLPPQRLERHLVPHLAPLLLLSVFALVTAVFAWNIGYEYRWSSDTTDTFYRIVSALPSGTGTRHGDLLGALWSGAVDVIAKDPVTDWYQALFDAYLRSFHLAFGDISLAYKVQVFPLTILFGFSAYFFFYWLTRNRWLALALAFAAVLPMPLSWAGERSGLGPIWNYTRRYFLTAWLPLLVFLYFRGMLDKRQLLLPALAGVGLASNLHASGILLLEVLVLAWLVADAISLKRVFQAGLLMAVGLLFSVASVGSLWKAGLGTITQIMLAALSSAALAADVTVLDKALLAMPEVQYLFYPPKIYAQLPSGFVAAWLLLTVIVSLWPALLRARRKEAGSLPLFAAASVCLLFISFEQMWVWVLLSAALYAAGRSAERPAAYTLAAHLIICNFWVAVVGMLAFQLSYGLIDGFPLVYNQLRGIRFMGFWVFVWLAVLGAPVAAGRRSFRSLSRSLVLAIGFALIVSGHNVYRNYFHGQDSESLERKKGLLDLATWAKKNTPPTSVFLVGYSPFGVLAERRVTHPDKTVRNAAIDWLPPKGTTQPEETLALARQFTATHVFIDPAQVSPELARCVRVANSVYALVETDCLQSVLPTATSGAVVAPGHALP